MKAQLFQGDCLDIIRSLDSCRFHLVYLDPPFFSQKTHRLLTRDRQRAFSFDDVWSSHTAYADFLYERLEEIRRVMHTEGSIFFHCDRNASHIIRFLLDELFGAENFRSEIIWHFRRWSNSQKSSFPPTRRFSFTRSPTPTHLTRSMMTIPRPRTSIRSFNDASVMRMERLSMIGTKTAKSFREGEEGRSSQRCVANSLSESKGEGESRVSDAEAGSSPRTDYPNCFQ